MTSLVWLLAAVAASFALSLALCWVIMKAGFKDEPKEDRKAQVQKAATPTAGGLGVAVAAIACALVALELSGASLSLDVTIAICASLAVMVLGLCDDRLELDALLKLAIMLGVCIGLVVLGVRADMLAPWPGASLALPAVIGAAGSILWLVVITNAVNFMDGANGLAMGMAAIAAAGFSACGMIAGAWDLAFVAATLAGALGGFLLLNVPGRLFVGDAGALFTGALLGALSLVLVKLRPDWLFVPPTLLLPFLTDVLLTLGWRAKHGKKLFQAHRDHAYQIAMKAGLKHWQVAGVHAIWALNAAGFGLVGAIAGGWAPLLAFVALLAVSVWAHLRIRQSGVKAGLVGADIA